MKTVKLNAFNNPFVYGVDNKEYLVFNIDNETQTLKFQSLIGDLKVKTANILFKANSLPAKLYEMVVEDDILTFTLPSVLTGYNGSMYVYLLLNYSDDLSTSDLYTFKLVNKGSSTFNFEISSVCESNISTIVSEEIKKEGVAKSILDTVSNYEFDKLQHAQQSLSLVENAFSSTLEKRIDLFNSAYDKANETKSNTTGDINDSDIDIPGSNADSDLRNYVENVKKQMAERLKDVTAVSKQIQDEMAQEKQSFLGASLIFQQDLKQERDIISAYGESTRQHMDQEFNEVKNFANKVFVDFSNYIPDLDTSIKQLNDKIDATDIKVEKILADGKQEIDQKIAESETQIDAKLKDSNDKITKVDQKVTEYDQYFASGKSDWEEFVNQNREIIESVDPGGELLSKIGMFDSFRSFDREVLTKMKNEFTERGINVRWFGAKGDGKTNDTKAIQDAINYAESVGSFVYIPSLIFATSTLQVTASIKGEGTLKFLQVSNHLQSLVIKKNNLYVRDINIDCASNCGAIFANEIDYLRIDNVKISNSYQMAIYCGECQHVIVSNNDIKDTVGNWGDCIFFTGCQSSEIYNNNCQNYTRIGIVTEGNTTEKSSDINIRNNKCINGHDASILNGGSEYNSGIWCENSKNLVISGNEVIDQTHYGIVVVPLSASVSDNHSVVIMGNKLGNAPTLIHLLSERGLSSLIKNNTYAGQYNIGINLGGDGGDVIDISSEFFGTTTTTSTSGAFIRLNVNFPTATKINISDCKKNTSILNQDLFFYYPHSNVIVTLRNLKGWSVREWDGTSQSGSLIVDNCDLLLSGVAFKGDRFECSGSSLRLNSSISLETKTESIFKNVVFICDVNRTINILGSGDATFENCDFDNNTVVLGNGTASNIFKFQTINFKKFGTYGAILCGLGQLRIYEARFDNGNEAPPIAAYNSNPSRIELRNIFSKTTDPLKAPLVAHVKVSCVAL